MYTLSCLRRHTFGEKMLLAVIRAADEPARFKRLKSRKSLSSDFRLDLT